MASIKYFAIGGTLSASIVAYYGGKKCHKVIGLSEHLKNKHAILHSVPEFVVTGAITGTAFYIGKKYKLPIDARKVHAWVPSAVSIFLSFFGSVFRPDLVCRFDQIVD